MVLTKIAKINLFRKYTSILKFSFLQSINQKTKDHMRSFFLSVCLPVRPSDFVVFLLQDRIELILSGQTTNKSVL